MKLVEGESVTDVKRGLILQQVNCQGVMGSGVAAAIRGKWPKVFEDYRVYCRSGVQPSDLLGAMNVTEVEPQLFVINLFGQLNYGREPKRYTSYDALDESLRRTQSWMKDHGWYSFDVNHPAIGSGLGGGHWPTVASLIDRHLGPETTLWLYP